HRALLLRNPWLRRLVALSAPLSGPLLARRWRASQRVLRDGLAPLGIAPLGIAPLGMAAQGVGAEGVGGRDLER
ncbi:MAG: hypothetical protein VKK43_05115, partial [Synechococcaceae cyanobacterium]|nr:hypothetical protein [Synechococcaceae cyanobacterium]